MARSQFIFYCPLFYKEAYLKIELGWAVYDSPPSNQPWLPSFPALAFRLPLQI